MKMLLKHVPGLRKVVRFIRGRPTQLPPRERLLARMPRRSICAEIGVHEGDFSEDILSAVKPVRLHLIDPWEFSNASEYKEAWYGGKAQEGQATMDDRFLSVTRRFRKAISAGEIVLHRGHSNNIAGEFSDAYFDWIYIDGNHLYEYVKQDLELFYPKIKAGGYLAGDDYGVKGWWFNGVQNAVDEFIRERSGLLLEVIGNQFIITKDT